MSKRACSLVLATVAALALSSCSDDESGGGEGPEEVLAQAKTTLDETSGIRLTLKTDDLPEGVTGIQAAEGVGTRAPAFDGTITVILSGTPFAVPVVAVDDKVYAELPLTSGFQEVDPTEYGAPDPAQLMSPETGFSSLLAEATDLEEGDTIRGGEGNEEVLTEYTATVPGDTVKNVIPSASGDFEATYTITEEGELRGAVLTGVFYPDSEEMTYTIGFDDYGTEKEITAP